MDNLTLEMEQLINEKASSIQKLCKMFEDGNIDMSEKLAMEAYVAHHFKESKASLIAQMTKTVLPKVDKTSKKRDASQIEAENNGPEMQNPTGGSKRKCVEVIDLSSDDDEQEKLDDIGLERALNPDDQVEPENWQSTAHISVRHLLFAEIGKRLNSFFPKMKAERKRELCLSFEGKLFQDAPSLQVYADPATLTNRIQGIAKEINKYRMTIKSLIIKD